MTRPPPAGYSGPQRATPASPEVFRRLPLVASPELLAVLGVEIDRPHPVSLSVRPETADVYGQIIELIPVGTLAGLVNQVDGHPVVRVHAATVLPERVTQGRGEL